MHKAKVVIARDVRELARVLAISDADRAALEVQMELVARIELEVRRFGMTHSALARVARTSRPRVTAILNGNLEGVSTDLLLRILAALGTKVQLRFRRAA